MNISLKSKIRHWFNFYRLALASKDPQIQANLQKSAAFYKPWGNIETVSFDDWWKTHSELFHRRERFEVLEGLITTDKDHLFLKIPYALSAIAASKVFTRIYREEFEKYLGKQLKAKRQYKGDFELTPLEFQAVNFRYYYLFAQKVYLPLLEKAGTTPKTKDLVSLAKEKFKSTAERTEKRSREVEKQRIAPFRQSIDSDYESLARTATRYRFITENLIRNVSLGVFPGEYQENGQKNLADKRKKASVSMEKNKVGRKRTARPVGYRKPIKIEDPDNPNLRKLYSKI